LSIPIFCGEHHLGRSNPRADHIRISIELRALLGFQRVSARGAFRSAHYFGVVDTGRAQRSERTTGGDVRLLLCRQRAGGRRRPQRLLREAGCRRTDRDELRLLGAPASGCDSNFMSRTTQIAPCPQPEIVRTGTDARCRPLGSRAVRLLDFERGSYHFAVGHRVAQLPDESTLVPVKPLQPQCQSVWAVSRIVIWTSIIY
jgi:hypothetical protein